MSPFLKLDNNCMFERFLRALLRFILSEAKFRRPNCTFGAKCPKQRAACSPKSEIIVALTRARWIFFDTGARTLNAKCQKWGRKLRQPQTTYY